MSAWRPTSRSSFSTSLAGHLGGPLYLPRFGEGGDSIYNGKNKTFFFTNLQLLRTSQAFFVNRTVYTQQARQASSDTLSDARTRTPIPPAPRRE